MRAGQRGAVLITGIILIVVIALMIATLGFLYVSNLRSSTLHSSSEQAYFAAFSGLERATRVVNSPTISGAVAPDVNRVPCASLTGDASVTAVTLVANKGQFTVTGGAAVYPATPVTLNGALSNVATVIPVTTLAALGGYSASGRIMIDRELIDYSATSNVGATCGTAPCFVGARRGAAGTTAVAHATGTRVGQFGCDVQSRGAVPDLANPRATRILSQSTQLHEGWIAGVAGGGGQQPGFARFRENVWSDYAFPGPAVNTQINGISMVSYADGFAVGNFVGVAANNPRVFRWDGTQWITVPTGVNTAQDLNAISCPAFNDCWAVGVTGGALDPWILRFNGVWTNVDTTAAPNLINIPRTLNSISCADSTNCIAVGLSGTVATQSRPFAVRMSGGNWGRIDNSAINQNLDLFGVHCYAVDRCWAVGQFGGVGPPNRRPYTIFWNGAAWVEQNNAAINVSQDLNAVFCVSANDCWAVGNQGVVGPPSARPFIIHWDGAAWTQYDSTALNLNVALRSVYCVNSNDCWAVGDTSGTELILRWNGVSWTRYTDAGALVSTRNLRAIHVIGAAQRAPAARQEVYP